MADAATRGERGDGAAAVGLEAALGLDAAIGLDAGFAAVFGLEATLGLDAAIGLDAGFAGALGLGLAGFGAAARVTGAFGPANDARADGAAGLGTLGRSTDDGFFTSEGASGREICARGGSGFAPADGGSGALGGLAASGELGSRSAVETSAADTEAEASLSASGGGGASLPGSASPTPATLETWIA